MFFAIPHIRVVAFSALLLAQPEFASSQSQADSYREFRSNFGVYQPAGSAVQTDASISGVRDYLEHDIQEVFQDARVGMTEYVFRVPDGTYRVALYFAEIEADSIGDRVFGIAYQGRPVVERLDIFSEAGANQAYRILSEYAEVSDGLLRVTFEAIVGEPLLSAISIDGDIAGASDLISRTFYAHMNCGGPGFYGFNPDFGM